MPWEDREGGQLVCGWQVSHLGNTDPEVSTIEDLDEGWPIHMSKKKKKKEMKLYHSDAKQEKCDFEICFKYWNTTFEKASCA